MAQSGGPRKCVVVGAGLAGLNCAKLLHENGHNVCVYEASDGIGGRVRTDEVEGFILDRGFQVLQTAYPAAQEALDYGQLHLVELEPGAFVRFDGKWNRMADPKRRPRYAFRTVFNRIGEIKDRLRLLRLRAFAQRSSIEEHLSRGSDRSVAHVLREGYGFSESFIDAFMRPWLSGMFLEPDLSTSANHFHFVFKMLSQDRISYPRDGMRSIPNQLAKGFRDRIHLETQVDEVHSNSVRLVGGEAIEADAVVVATDMSSAARLSGEVLSRRWNSTTCRYYVAEEAPTAERSLMLNGVGPDAGPVNHVFIPTNSVPGLSPDHRSLISVSMVGEAEERDLEQRIRNQMQDWFGQKVGGWRFLAEYRIPHALPAHEPGFWKKASFVDEDGIFRCGDYLITGSLQGALQSGQQAAMAMLKSFHSTT
ncbi:MAG: NAD(P)/FAD-dependent oxidoreductase [Planctomycetota bacterium]